MIYAYDKNYLNDVETNMANACDIVVNIYKKDLEDYFDRFNNSNLPKKIESGDVRTIAGSSANDWIIELYGENIIKKNVAVTSIKKGKEYWLGKALSYYQWYSNKTFKEIFKKISVKDLLLMYNKYHEMDIMQFVDKINEIMGDSIIFSKLKRRRELLNISQRELSELSNVSYRTIQQYEQKKKDIKKASAETVMSLAKALNCEIKEII